MSTEPTLAPEAGHRFLRCPTCGRSDAVTHDGLTRHARDGWPTCCGQVMDYAFVAPVSWVAECHLCARTITADAADMFRYLRDGWPPCCGYPMTFRVVHAPPLSDAETKT